MKRRNEFPVQKQTVKEEQEHLILEIDYAVRINRYQPVSLHMKRALDTTSLTENHYHLRYSLL